MIAVVTVKYALKSVFVDKFIDFLRTETKYFAVWWASGKIFLKMVASV